jgi:hypothetical protein
MKFQKVPSISIPSLRVPTHESKRTNGLKPIRNLSHREKSAMALQDLWHVRKSVRKSLECSCPSPNGVLNYGSDGDFIVENFNFWTNIGTTIIKFDSNPLGMDNKYWIHAVELVVCRGLYFFSSFSLSFFSSLSVSFSPFSLYFSPLSHHCPFLFSLSLLSLPSVKYC